MCKGICDWYRYIIPAIRAKITLFIMLVIVYITCMYMYSVYLRRSLDPALLQAKWQTAHIKLKIDLCRKFPYSSSSKNPHEHITCMVKAKLYQNNNVLNIIFMCNHFYQKMITIRESWIWRDMYTLHFMLICTFDKYHMLYTYYIYDIISSYYFFWIWLNCMVMITLHFLC